MLGSLKKQKKKNDKVEQIVKKLNQSSFFKLLMFFCYVFVSSVQNHKVAKETRH